MGAGVWVSTSDGWVRGDQIVEVKLKRSKYSSYGKEVSTHYVTITQLGGYGAEGGPSSYTLWRTEGGDGKALARAAVALMEFISGPDRGVVVYWDDRVQLVSFTHAALTPSISEAD